jgi:hypothetical protein
MFIGMTALANISSNIPPHSDPLSPLRPAHIPAQLADFIGAAVGQSLCHGRGRGFESRRPRHSFQAIAGRDTGNSNPQLNPRLLIHRGAHPHS